MRYTSAVTRPSGCFRPSLVLSLAIALSAVGCQRAPASEHPRSELPTTAPNLGGLGATRSTVYAPSEAVATSHPLASATALGVLASGGNAFDAAVSAAAVLNVVEPHMTGIGGDMFALAWSARENRLVGLDASGRSGSLVDAEAARAQGATEVPYRGAAAVTVPGALSGWAALLGAYGTLSLSQALQPAIALAEEGFPVSPIIAKQWRGEEEILRNSPGDAARVYLVDGGRAPVAGEWVNNADLARSLRQIAAEGPGALYGGSLGEQIVRGLHEYGGGLTLEDLRSHQVSWVTPLSVTFNDYELWELPPAGQGIAALEMLRILEPYNLQAMGHNSVAYLHHLVEAKKLAFADLAEFISDPSTMPVSASDLLDEGYVRSRRARLDPERASDRVEPGRFASHSDTIYLSVADRHGNMVSLINSLYEYFGSAIVVPGTGIALQNRGAGFVLEPGHPNEWGPRKKPFHTLIPGFVTKGGRPWLAFGVMGGSMQPQGHVQVLLNLLLFDMDLQTAIDAPRVRHRQGRTLMVESGIRHEVRKGLAAKGHTIVEKGPDSFGGAQGVMRRDRGWGAGSDRRKDGLAIGR
ncbi:MAG: gamma-glutamyltransferase [Myxococcales bacterium FL481]|nr:MAG: gamma-glutamyltransferase [Myxococcales bacterium FL481]